MSKTYEPSDTSYWCGRLSMACAVSKRHPQIPMETVAAFLVHGKPDPQLAELLRKELKTK